MRSPRRKSWVWYPRFALFPTFVEDTWVWLEFYEIMWARGVLGRMSRLRRDSAK